MPDDFSIDTSQLGQLEADLGEAVASSGQYINSAMQHTSVNIQDAWREKATGNRYAPQFPGSITYDLEVYHGFGASVLRSDIGPDKDRPQGALGNLLEYGSVNNPPRGYGLAALQENEQDFQDGLEKALADAIHVVEVGSSITRSAGAIVRGSFR